MSIYVISVDKAPPKWAEDSVTHYQNKIPKSQRFICQSVASASTTSQTIDAAKKDEAKRLLQHIEKKSYVIALTITANQQNSEQWAKKIQQLNSHYPHLTFLIGGTYGLHHDCLQTADQQWSLSPLTFSHTLARVILAEQLFRSWCIANHHPYHQTT